MWDKNRYHVIIDIGVGAAIQLMSGKLRASVDKLRMPRS
jgi:hypothetical protein